MWGREVEESKPTTTRPNPWGRQVPIVEVPLTESGLRSDLLQQVGAEHRRIYGCSEADAKTFVDTLGRSMLRESAGRGESTADLNKRLEQVLASQKGRQAATATSTTTAAFESQPDGRRTSRRVEIREVSKP